MSLYYADAARRGKTAANEDRFAAKFLELVPNQKIVEAVRFKSSDSSFSDEMIMEVRLEPVAGGTKITFLFRNIPSSIRPEDNEKGTEQTMDKLAKYVE
ncbi:SRPBCC domain-containing protein [Puia sp. P3]|uniref:SRPBCC domain-containing protein n=1 Tax=Puia sp. P3 TaxID=3423952 RepID=UPI003D67E64D